MIARASPRRRHGRRTLMCSSQPRLTPSRSFSSGQIQFWTTPAISSPSQATTHRLGVELGPAEGRRVGALGHLAVTPVVAERLVLGVEDRPPLVLGDRPDLEAVGERRVRDVVERRRGASGRSDGPPRSPALVSSARWPISLSSANDCELDPHERVLARRADAGTRQVPAEQRRPDAAAPHVGMDRAPDLVVRDVLADDPLDAGRARRPGRRSRRAPCRRPDRRRRRRPSRPGGSAPSAGTGRRPRGWPRWSARTGARSRTRRGSGGPSRPGMAGGVLQRHAADASCGRHRVPPPYLRFMCSSTRLVDDLPGAAVLGPGPRVALAGGAGQLAFELPVAGQPLLGESVPSASAARTAQPGSPSWRQSLKRQVAAMSATSSKAVSTPSSAPSTSSARMPGVSTSSAPPGSSNSSRWVVVCRPRESESRTSAVAWRSSPSRALTSVDLPTPDEPRIAAVVPGSRCARSSSRPWPGPRRDGDRRDARGDRVDRDEPAVDVVGEVGLVEDDDRRDLARPGDREVALDPAQVEVVVEPRDEQGDVDVRGHDLLVVEAACRAGCVGGHPLEDAAPRQDRARSTSSAPSTTQSPTAGKSERASASNRNDPETLAGRSLAVAVAHDRRSRDGRPRPGPGGAPSAANGAKAAAQSASQPRGSSADRSSAIGQPTRFSLPVRLA